MLRRSSRVILSKTRTRKRCFGRSNEHHPHLLRRHSHLLWRILSGSSSSSSSPPGLERPVGSTATTRRKLLATKAAKIDDETSSPKFSSSRLHRLLLYDKGNDQSANDVGREEGKEEGDGSATLPSSDSQNHTMREQKQAHRENVCHLLAVDGGDRWTTQDWKDARHSFRWWTNVNNNNNNNRDTADANNEAVLMALSLLERAVVEQEHAHNHHDDNDTIHNNNNEKSNNSTRRRHRQRNNDMVLFLRLYRHYFLNQQQQKLQQQKARGGGGGEQSNCPQRQPLVANDERLSPANILAQLDALCERCGGDGSRSARCSDVFDDNDNLDNKRMPSSLLSLAWNVEALSLLLDCVLLSLGGTVVGTFPHAQVHTQAQLAESLLRRRVQLKWNKNDENRRQYRQWEQQKQQQQQGHRRREVTGSGNSDSSISTIIGNSPLLDCADEHDLLLYDGNDSYVQRREEEREINNDNDDPQAFVMDLTTALNRVLYALGVRACDPERAWRLLDQLQEEEEERRQQGEAAIISPDVVSYNTLLAAHAAQGQGAEAQAVLDDMIFASQQQQQQQQLARRNPAGYNYDECLYYADDDDDVENDRQRMMIRHKIQPDVRSFNTTLAAWAKRASVYAKTNAATNMTRTNLNRSNNHIDTIRNSATNFEVVQEAATSAEALFWRMVRSGDTNLEDDEDDESRDRIAGVNAYVQPDTVSLNTVLQCWAQLATAAAARPSAENSGGGRAGHHKKNAVVAAQKAMALLREMQPEPSLARNEENRKLSLRPTSDGGVSATVFNATQPDVVSYATVMNALAKAGQAPEAQILLDEVYSNYIHTGSPEWQLTVHTLTNMLEAWSRTGSLAKAEYTFERMHELYLFGFLATSPDLTAYNAMLRAFTQAKDQPKGTLQATVLLQKMIESSSLPSATENQGPLVDSGTILPSTTKQHSMNKRSDRDPPSPCAKSYSIVVHALVRCANTNDFNGAERALVLVNQAVHAFESGHLDTDPRTTPMINAILRGLCRSQRQQHKSRSDDNHRHYQDNKNNSASCYKGIQTAEMVLWQWCRACSAGACGPEAQPDDSSFGCLVAAWCRSGHPKAAQKAQSLVDRMQHWYRQKQEQYQTRIHGNTSPNNNLMATTIVREPDYLLYRALLMCWAKSSIRDGPNQALVILNKMRKRAMQRKNDDDDDCKFPDTLSYNQVIQAFCKKGKPRQAEQVLRQMCNDYKNAHLYNIRRPPPQPDAISFNQVLTAWARFQAPYAVQRTENLLLRMHHLYDSGDLDSAAPDVISYNNLLNCLANAANKSGGTNTAAYAEAILWKMAHSQQNQHSPTLARSKTTNNYVTNVLEKHLLPHPNAVSYGTVIKGHIRAENPERAEAVLWEMNKRFAMDGDDGVKPHREHFELVAGAWSSLSSKVDAPNAQKRAKLIEKRMHQLYPRHCQIE